VSSAYLAFVSFSPAPHQMDWTDKRQYELKAVPCTRTPCRHCDTVALAVNSAY